MTKVDSTKMDSNSSNETLPRDGRANGVASESSEKRLSILRLIALIVGSVVISVVFRGFWVLIVVLALVAMVMLHEFGHFITAKLSGMKVTEYFLGFGPRLWSFRRGETEYGIKLIPAGGYVRITGMSSAEEVAPEDEARSFRQATFPRRILVAVAGSTMHIVMALVLLWTMFSFIGVPTSSVAQVAGVSSFVGGPSPAQRAGFKFGDEFVAIDGHRYSNPSDFVSYIESHPGRLLSVIVLRHGHDVTLSVRPRDRRTIRISTPQGIETLAPKSAKPAGAIGVEINFLTANRTTNPFNAVVRSGAMLGSMTKQTIAGITQVFSLSGLSSFAHSVATANHHPVTTNRAGGSSGSAQLLSIYGAVAIGAQAAQQNVALLIYILVAINLFVGFINLFPMLPLDGGHVVVAIYERIRSRKGRAYHADITKLTPVVALFLVFMVVMGVAALYANIVQPVSLSGR